MFKNQIFQDIKLFLLAVVFLFTNFHLKAKEINFQAPVDIPITLSGSFGELRDGHFHSGIDIRTNGKSGLAVKAIEKGYISRISVSPFGFGRALYIAHPNGYTSVYGHLQKFSPKIEAYIKKQQYKQKNFSVNLYLKTNQFNVKKGEIIARSGNSGSSGGPHLHFEIRRTKNQHPINPWPFFNIIDDKNPTIKQIAIYPIGTNSHVKNKTEGSFYDVAFYNNTFHLSGNPTVPVFGKIGFGVNVVDYITGSWSKCGINKMEILLDGKLVFQFNINEIDFSTTRYINSHIDYESYYTQNKRFHKSMIDPGNKLHFYNRFIGDGTVILTDGQIHEITIKVKDSAGNESKSWFKVLSTLPGKQTKASLPKEDYKNDFSYKDESVIINFEPYSFYTDFVFTKQKELGNDTIYSDIHSVMSPKIPVHKYFDLSIKPNGNVDSIGAWLLIAKLDEKKNKWQAVGGEYKEGYVLGKAREFGKFAIVKDDVAPEIESLSIKRNQLLDKYSIRFKAKDNFSGISSYEGYIDGNWVLFEYDAKNDLFIYRIDEHLKKGKEHQIIFNVQDLKGNISAFYATFSY